MLSNDQIELALKTLEKSKEEIILEIARCGSAGGVGRVANYAPQLVNVNGAIDIVADLLVVDDNKDPAQMTDAQLRAANARAAKAAKQ